jgi:hypothetical protein
MGPDAMEPGSAGTLMGLPPNGIFTVRDVYGDILRSSEFVAHPLAATVDPSLVAAADGVAGIPPARRAQDGCRGEQRS